jgi:hypothetical protein
MMMNPNDRMRITTAMIVTTAELLFIQSRNLLAISEFPFAVTSVADQIGATRTPDMSEAL